MAVQLEFDFFDWKKYETIRAQAIASNVPPVIGESLLMDNLITIDKEPQVQYHEWLKDMLKSFKND